MELLQGNFALANAAPAADGVERSTSSARSAQKQQALAVRTNVLAPVSRSPVPAVVRRDLEGGPEMTRAAERIVALEHTSAPCPFIARCLLVAC